MDLQLERRTGNERRQIFLLVPDRRKYVDEQLDRRTHGDNDDFEPFDHHEPDPERMLTGNYWGADDDIRPVE
jgi:hypothetical protein